MERAVALSAGRQQLNCQICLPRSISFRHPLKRRSWSFPENGLDMPAYLAAIERDLMSEIS